MHTHFHSFHRQFYRLLAVGVVTLAVLISACTGERDRPALLPIDTPVSTVPADSIFPTATVMAASTDLAAKREPWPEGQPVEQSQWVKDRLAAVEQIFKFTPAGEEWINGYDFRQMVEQPAWFGSHGYSLWAGAGEAIPRSVLHEISHSYWGAFSVEGRPELSWDTTSGDVSPALQAFRDDLDEFMKQPPDRFEPLRDRFRNLPGLNTGDYPDLFHFGEAELLYMTGGNLQLIPPILRPYYSGYLAEGGVSADGGITPQSWDHALSWFNSLQDDDRRIAEEVFGLQHFPTEPYADLPGTTLSGLDETLRTVYEDEERQRLIDFAKQFEGIVDREFSLVDAAGADRGFDFWRSYLSDKMSLHIRYPNVLREAGSRGEELADALDLYREMAGLPASSQVGRFREETGRPLVPELAVLLKPRAIVELFAESSDENGVAAVLGSRADRLAALVQAVERVEEIDAESGPDAAAVELDRFMRSVPEDQLRADMFLLLDLLRSGSTGLASSVLPALDDDALVFLLNIQSSAARSYEISPERLLGAVGIAGTVPLDQVAAGAKVLFDHSSGNFAIDAQYDLAIYERLDRFVESDPEGVLAAVLESGSRLEPWIARESSGALDAMRAAPDAAADALSGLSGSRETPWRMVHLVAKDDPELAAELAVKLAAPARRGEGAIQNVVREFAYDQYWWERHSGPDVDPRRFGEFLVYLRGFMSLVDVNALVANAVDQLRAEIKAEKVEADAMAEFRRTASSTVELLGSWNEGALREALAGTGLID